MIQKRKANISGNLEMKGNVKFKEENENFWNLGNVRKCHRNVKF